MTKHPTNKQQRIQLERVKRKKKEKPERTVKVRLAKELIRKEESEDELRQFLQGNRDSNLDVQH